MQCLSRKSPIIDHTLLYRTRKGKVANTIHNVYPLFQNRRLNGAVCFVKDYNVLEDTISSVSIPKDKNNYSNGTRFTFANIVSENMDYLKALNMARRTAKTPSPVMLYGETGTGKELFAQAIHNHAFKGDRRYIPVNCSAIPENLLEGILFGTTQGAFTGAQSKPGLFEKANGGTLFLDEVDSMGTALQAKILRVIQEKKVRRLGSLEEIEIDIKIISSINSPPEESIKRRLLREDLFYRLGVVFITIPPLREHMDDIEGLVSHFIHKHSHAINKQVAGISDQVMKKFTNYHWPGNIRELEHVIESAINMIEDDQTIDMQHLKSCFINLEHPEGGRDAGELRKNAPEVRFNDPQEIMGMQHNNLSLLEEKKLREKRFIEQALKTNEGNVSMTARTMGISRQLLYYKLKKYDIRR
jgi:arginine utilization regulatory protein